MLRDDTRNEAFRKALFARVRPNHVVLDVGAGSGILSMFAAQAGAARVYAVERTSIAHLARRLIRANGFADRIQVIEAEMDKVVLPEVVDVIVSEWLGTIGVDENMLSHVLVARDRWLKPGGLMLPERVTAMIAPALVESMEDEMNFWPSKPYDLDLSLVGQAAGQEYGWTNHHNGNRQPAKLLAEPQMMWTTDTYRIPRHASHLPTRTQLEFRIEREGRCNGLVAWFVADFGAGVTLSTAPDSPATHWRQYVYPFYRGVPVKRGTELAVEVTCLPFVSGYSHQAWSMRVDGGRWEHHDTRRVVWLE